MGCSGPGGLDCYQSLPEVSRSHWGSYIVRGDGRVAAEGGRHNKYTSRKSTTHSRDGKSNVLQMVGWEEGDRLEE